MILAVAAAGLFSYEELLRSRYGAALFEGFYFQAWPSDVMMQTVIITDLRLAGLSAFYYLHVQPPIYDFVRYVLSFDLSDPQTVVNGTALDGRIYVFYCAVFGAFSQLIFLWGRALGFGVVTAAFFALLWAVYPGNIAMATLLESTYLSAFLVGWMVFALYLYLQRPSLTWLTVFLVLFILTTWTRTVFQVHFTVCLAIVVFALIARFHRDRTGLTLLVVSPAVAIAFLLPLKQHYLFGTFATTSFAGQHQIEGVWYYPTTQELEGIAVPEAYVANARAFVSKLNNPDQLITNYRLEALFGQLLTSSPSLVMSGVAKSLAQGLQKTFAPTQSYQPNFSVDGHPLADVFATVSTGEVYAALLLCALLGYGAALATGIVAFQQRYLVLAAFMILAFLTIVIGSNRYAWTEAERLRFLLEAPFLLLSARGVQLLGKVLVETFGSSSPRADRQSMIDTRPPA